MKTTTTRWQWLLASLWLGIGFALAHAALEWWHVVAIAVAANIGVAMILRLVYESAAHREGRLQVKAQQKRRRAFMAERIAEGMTERQAGNAWFALLMAEDRVAAAERHERLLAERAERDRRAER